MTLESLLPIIIIGSFIAFAVIERLIPARALPGDRSWYPKGVIFFVMTMAMNAILPALVLTALAGVSLVDLRPLGMIGGTALLLLVFDVVGYAIHRGEHSNSFVWRWTHQLHHSAERMDMMGAVYFHPFDFLAQQILPTIAVFLIFRVEPTTAALVGLIGFFLGVMPHMNVRTPHWLGYVVQRPEMHALHHTRGIHAYNYGVLAFSDLVFGTWRNPKEFTTEPAGFWDGASKRVGAMLIGRDVGTVK